MRARVRTAAIAAAGVLLVAAVALIVVLHQSLAGTLLLNGAGKFLGDHVAADDVRLSLTNLTVRGLRITSMRGEPILEAERLGVDYNLRDLFPGGKHRFGLSAVDVERPHLTLIHRHDGTYNITPPGGSQQGNQQAAPLDVRVAVRNGSATFVDERRSARRQPFSIDALNADVALHSVAASRYDVRLVIAEGAARYPVRGRGLLDDARGWEMQRWTAARIGIAPLVDFALDATVLTMTAGELRDVDVKYSGIPDATGQLARHLDVDARLAATTFYLAGLALPVRDARGALHGYDDGVVANRLDASFADAPLRIAGGLFDFARPSFDIGVVGQGTLQRLIAASPAAARLPLGGNLAFGLLVEGEATHPLLLARFRSPGVTYQRMLFEAPQGSVALRGDELDVVSMATSYAAVRLGAHGSVILRRDPQVEFAGRVWAPAGVLPFADRIIPGVAVDGEVVAQGTGSRIASTGVLAGSSAQQRVGGVFNVAADGTGVAGPLSIDGPGDSSLYARVALDRPHGQVAGFVTLRDFALRAAGDRQLPGLSLPSLPPVSGVLDARAVGVVGAHGLAAWGDARARDASVNGVPIDDLRVRVASGSRDLSIPSLEMRAPWGTLTGSGDVASGRAAFEGRLRGSLAALGRIAGNSSLGGDVDVPLRIVWDGRQTLAQVSGARLRGTRIAGVAVTSVDGTFGLRSDAFDVYAADAGIAGGRVVATGSLGDGGTLGVSTGDVPIPAFGGAGAALTGGHVAAVARIGGTLAAPRADADVSVFAARLRGQPVDATTALAFRNGRLNVIGGTVLLGATTIGFGGNVDGLVAGRAFVPRYDVDASVRAGDIGVLAENLRAGVPLGGSLDADVHVGGAGSAPRVAGELAVPEGTVNGLFYHDARVRINGSASGVTANGGSVTVGSSTLAFGGTVTAGARSLQVDSRRADLSDFNNLFDPGDMLAGVGPIDANVALSAAALRTRGALYLAGSRYARFPFGTVAARWGTVGRTVSGTATVDGRGGYVNVLASALLPPTRPIDDLTHRSIVDMRTSARGVDLGTWLPAAGYWVPVAGRVDADVTAHGTPARTTLDSHASLAGGVVGRFAIDHATLALTARDGRATISSLALDTPSLTVAAAGSFGFRPSDAVDAHVQVATPNITALAASLGAKVADLVGSASSRITISGSLRRPSIGASLDAAQFAYRGVAVPRVHADFSLDDREAQLRDAEIDFQHGLIRASARAPLDIKHPGLRPNAPVSGMLALSAIDASNFAPLVPKGSTITGSLDGQVTVAGLAAAPAFAGTVTLANGSYAGPTLKSPVRNVTAQLAFANGNLTLTRAHADIGSGGVDAAGTASASLADPLGTVAFRARARAQNVNLNAPAYFNGIVNGDIDLARAPGEPITVGGSATIPYARIPLTALYHPSADATAAPPAFPVAFDLAVTAGRDVRVQSGPVDVGATGNVHVGGTLAAPALAGRIVSTGGSISFYRTFTIQRGVLTFSPSDGVIPTVDATATTSVPQPSTDVTLNVTGLATQLNVQLVSNPAYSREQILGLLLGAQQLGAVSGVAQSTTTGGPNLVQSLAVGTLSQQFTRQLLEPLSAGLGQALGLRTLSLNYDPYGGVSARAVKRLGKHLEGVYAESFNYPKSQSIGLIAHPSPTTSYQFTFFQQQGNGVFNPLTIATSTNPALTALTPASGTSGYALTIQRHF